MAGRRVWQGVVHDREACMMGEHAWWGHAWQGGMRGRGDVHGRGAVHFTPTAPQI